MALYLVLRCCVVFDIAVLCSVLRCACTVVFNTMLCLMYYVVFNVLCCVVFNGASHCIALDFVVQCGGVVVCSILCSM